MAILLRKLLVNILKGLINSILTDEEKKHVIFLSKRFFNQ